MPCKRDLYRTGRPILAVEAWHDLAMSDLEVKRLVSATNTSTSFSVVIHSGPSRRSTAGMSSEASLLIRCR